MSKTEYVMSESLKKRLKQQNSKVKRLHVDLLQLPKGMILLDIHAKHEGS